MTFWGAFFGVFLGIVSGVIIHLLIGWIQVCRYKKNTIKNLIFEIDFNIKRINELLPEVDKYRNKLVTNDIENYFGYFTLTQVIITTMIQMFQDRSIYKILDYEDIGNLQIFYKFFQPAIEKMVNDQVTFNKQHYQKQPEVKKPEAIKIISGQIDVLENAFKRNKSDLEKINKKLK